MPQKVNPIQSEVVVGMSIVASSLAAALCRLMVVPHERAAGEWQAEWQVIPQLCDLAAGSLRSASNIAHHMSVHPDAMAENLKRDNGLVLAEAFMIGLAEPMGREAAHDLVYEAAMEVRRSGVPLGDVLREMVSGEHSENLEVLVENTRPDTYVGESRELCDRGLGVWRQATVGE
jgi:3-carboxy-cis,cis-muconate cycloisomerase